MYLNGSNRDDSLNPSLIQKGLRRGSQVDFSRCLQRLNPSLIQKGLRLGNGKIARLLGDV